MRKPSRRQLVLQLFCTGGPTTLSRKQDKLTYSTRSSVAFPAMPLSLKLWRPLQAELCSFAQQLRVLDFPQALHFQWEALTSPSHAQTPTHLTAPMAGGGHSDAAESSQCVMTRTPPSVASLLANCCPGAAINMRFCKPVRTSPVK